MVWQLQSRPAARLKAATCGACQKHGKQSSSGSWNSRCSANTCTAVAPSYRCPSCTPLPGLSICAPHFLYQPSLDQAQLLRDQRRLCVSDPVIGLQVVDLDALRELAWSGVPSDLRPTCWQLLLGYLPPNRERRYDTPVSQPLFNLSFCEYECPDIPWHGKGEHFHRTICAFYNSARALGWAEEWVSRCHMTGFILS